MCSLCYFRNLHAGFCNSSDCTWENKVGYNHIAMTSKHRPLHPLLVNSVVKKCNAYAAMWWWRRCRVPSYIAVRENRTNESPNNAEAALQIHKSNIVLVFKHTDQMIARLGKGNESLVEVEKRSGAVMRMEMTYGTKKTTRGQGVMPAPSSLGERRGVAMRDGRWLVDAGGCGHEVDTQAAQQ